MNYARPILGTSLASALLAALLVAPPCATPLPAVRAEEEAPEALPGVGSEVEQILDAFSDGLSGLYADEKLVGKERKLAERTLRAETRQALLALVDAHRPGGTGPRRDLSEAYQTLFSPSFEPPPERARALALELLTADVGTPGAWGIASRLREAQVLGAAEDPVGKADDLRVWASGAASRFPGGSAAALAFELLAARLELDTGNASGAAGAAARIAARQAGGEDLLGAAAALAEEAGRLPAGFTAPAFRLPRKGDGAHVALERFAGRAVLVLFRVDDPRGADLEHFAYSLTALIPSHELAVVVIPVADEVEDVAVMEDPDATGWHVIDPGAENTALAAAYRVGSRSALFLVGTDGKVLESSRWELPDATERVKAHIRATVGAPLDEGLTRVQRSSGWKRFREVWTRLARGRRAVDSPDALEQALAAGEKAVYALMLAGAASGRPIAYPFDKPPATLHGRIVAAWCGRESLDGSQRWMDLTAPLLNPKGDEALAIVDALYDLGIAAGDARARLEIAAEKSRDWRIVSMALRTLANADTESQPTELLRHGNHRQWQVRLALAEALVAYRGVESVEALISLLGDKRARIRAAAAVSLKDLTGYDFGVVQKDWAAWRREQGTALQVLPRGGDAHQASDAHRYAAGGYFGLKITSNRLVFVLDKSESMYYGLWDAAVDEMELFLTTAGPTTSFAIVEFDAEARVWKKKLAAANGRTVKGAVQWLQRAKPYGPTNVMDSLDLGFDVKDVDTVVLLSDGLPNRGAATKPDDIIARVAGENRYTRLAIHTVWMERGRMFEHDGPRGKDKPPLDEGEKARRKRIRDGAGGHPLARFLMELARLHDGTFGIAFGDMYKPPPGAGTRPSTDR